jgi:uncharacterized protein (DUF1778 family)
MAKRPVSPSKTTRAAAPEPVERSSAVTNLRIGPDTRRLIDDAAAVLGKSRTEFIVESARQAAMDVLLDQRLFVLDPGGYGAFVRVLDHPPAPGPKLKALLRRLPAWER